MSNMKQLFEKELKNKLSLKSSGHTSEETVLLKAFKYFDLDNSGNCSKEEWLKAISKIGITGFTEKNLLDLFDLYDLNKNEELDYKEFVGALYFNTSISRSKNVVEEKKQPVKPEFSEDTKNVMSGKSKKAYLQVEGVEPILEKIRSKLSSRGVRGIISIGKAFRIMDDNNSRSLDINEFKKAVKDYRWELNDSEVERAFVAFDRTGCGEIDYDEFLRTIRGSMNSFRRKFVDQAFSFMDKDGNGYLDINDIRNAYNGKFHPDVKAGKKTEEEVLLEFLETFEGHHNIFNSEAPDHIVTKDEWLEYYENVSMSIDDDKYFELMMNNCWKMNSNTTYNNNKKGWSNKEEEKSANVQEAYQKRAVTPTKNQVQDEQPKSNTGNVLLDKFRDKIIQRGGKGIIGLARQFKIFDDNNSKTLEFDEFAKAVKDFRIDLSPNEVKVLFGIFDNDGQGTIDYEEFLRLVKGEMNSRRKNIVLQAFDKLDTDKSGIIEVNEIKYLYSAKNHPEVKSGRKSEEEILGEFLETFETHHNINRGMKDRRVTREEFLEYYNNISMSIDNDEYFEVMMKNCWKLEGSNGTPQKAWAGDYTENKNRGVKAPQGKVFQNAPFGVSNEPTNYSTSLRPNTAQPNNFSKKGDEVVLKFREKLASRGTRGIMGIRRSFMICDDNNTKTINVDEFTKLIKDYRIALNDQESRKLFALFDRDNSGEIDYDEFLSGVVGEMNDFRKALVIKAFKKMDKDNSGNLELADIRGTYSAKNHPDVKAGKKTEDEVLAEFLDTFEYHFSLLNDKKSKDRSITADEFVEYYNQISMSIDEDKYFELMITNAYLLDGPKNYGKGWKGEY